ncbi:MAG: hypothetical protein HY700_19810 [Gemmatimonadetes bacterium]|nr:hypothetical protein [Gemmatimonadota bacterium]
MPGGNPEDRWSSIRSYVRGTVVLCVLLFCVGILGALIGAKVGVPPKRIALASIGGIAFLLVAQPPLWLEEWRRALGESRARLVLLLTGILAFVLAFAPLSWLRALAG